MSKAKYFSNFKYPNEKTYDINKTFITFDIDNVDVGMVNSIRRTHKLVNTFGFRTHPYEKNDINVIKNDSKLHNQMITDRIGLIPIHITDSKFEIDNYEFLIDVSKIINEIKTKIEITSKDIKILDIKKNTFISEKERDKIFPKDPLTNEYIMITKIFSTNNFIEILDFSKVNKTEFKVKAKAVSSNGEEHSRWYPACVFCYENKIDEKKAIEGKKNYVKDEIKRSKEKNVTPLSKERLEKRFDTSLKERYFYEDENGEPTKFIFKIETIGVLPPLIIFYKCIIELCNRVKNLIINFKNKNENIITIKPSSNLPDGFMIEIKEEDDTIGNMVNEHLYNLFIGKELNYIGFKKPHPLQKKIVFSVQSDKYTKEEDIINKIMIHGCQSVVNKLNALQKELEKQKEFISELKLIK